ncbi:MAG: hypothetical protein M0C28_31745 [Candidatus Moduliflexus flocculans]|nr:hypothetical protein [Candidatus Moduliflexus flocculans]
MGVHSAGRRRPERHLERLRRPCLRGSPAIRAASRIALEQAGLSLDDIGAFDLYSCFPSAYDIARREDRHTRRTTQGQKRHGRSPYFRRPGNNYTMHAIATVVERIRKDRTRRAMVTANGWYLTKHSVGIYGGTPRPTPGMTVTTPPIRRSIDAGELPKPRGERASGTLTEEAYVIRHNSAGRPLSGTVIGRLHDGSRALADIDAGRDHLLEMEEERACGHERRGPARSRPRQEPGPVPGLCLIP